ncbi:ABC transporter ATP-binding protein [bacterium]|jgi:putative lipid A export ATP-binding/permease protein msbA|nr:ABC transporter ATP-binding protein [bacterium]
MLREYYHFIKEYFLLVELKIKYVVIVIVSALFDKGFSLLIPFFGSLIISSLTSKNEIMSYFYLFSLFITYILYDISLYINYKVYGFNVNFCYNQLTTKVLNKLVTVDHNFTSSISKGRLMNSINSDIIDIGDMNDRISELITGLIQIIALLVIVGFYNIYIAIIFILFSIIYIIVRNKADRKINFYYNKVVVQDDKYSTFLSQIVSGLQEIKTFSMISKLERKLSVIQKQFNKNYTLKRKYITLRDNDVKVISYTFRFFLYLLLLTLMIQGKIDISKLVLMIAYYESLINYINAFIESTSAIRETNTAVNRINTILNYNSKEILFGTVDTDDVFGMIEFKNVSLKIKDTEILHNINLKINHNEVVAIVGEAGSGKTMMFNLLLRLFEPTKGKILLDNINIYDFSKEVYTSNVSVVNQKPFVFNMSIRRNLDFVDKNIKHQIEACKKAGIHDFIETLPDGYNTVLRENGSNVSGGQKQMISIARTILSDAEVLLFDDITTSLDPDTAKFVPKLIDNLKKDHTIIMITKKPELMKTADKIVVLDHGKINDIGTHKQLIQTNEIYQMLQSRKSPSKIGVFDNV